MELKLTLLHSNILEHSLQLYSSYLMQLSFEFSCAKTVGL